MKKSYRLTSNSINKNFFIRIWIYDLWITRHQVFLGESARILGNRIERFQEGIGR